MIIQSAYYVLVKEEFLRPIVSDEALQDLIELTLEFIKQQEEANGLKNKHVVYYEDPNDDEETKERDKKWSEEEPQRKENYITAYFKLLREITSWLKADYVSFDIVEYLNTHYQEDLSLPRLKVGTNYVYPEGWNWMMCDGKISIYFEHFSYYHNQLSIDESCFDSVKHPGWWGYKWNYKTKSFSAIELTHDLFYKLMDIRTSDDYVI